MNAAMRRVGRYAKDVFTLYRRWWAVLLLLALIVGPSGSAAFALPVHNDEGAVATARTKSMTTKNTVTDDVVFFVRNGQDSWDDGTVYAIEASSGLERWHVETDGPVLGLPVVEDGTVYFGNDRGHLFAIDLESGDERWRFDSVSSERVRTPVVANGIVYVGTEVTSGSIMDVFSAEGTIYALDAATGQERWSRVTERGITSAPAVNDGLVYVAVDSDGLIALDATSGERVWTFPSDEGISGPLAMDGIVYVNIEQGVSEGELVALDGATGKLVWTLQTGQGSSSAPKGLDGAIFVRGGDVSAYANRDFLYAVDAVTGQERWQFTTEGLISSPATVSVSRVFVGSWVCQTPVNDGFGLFCPSGEHGNLYSIDAATGQERWHVAMAAPIYSNPTVLGETVFVSTSDDIYAIETATGKERWHVRIEI